MRLVILIALLMPMSAHAGPLIAVIAAYIGATETVIAIIQVAVTIGMAIYGSAQQRKAQREQEDAQRNQYNAGLQDRTVTGVATETPHVYIYGRARVGSAIVGMFASGDKDQFRHLVCVHAAHECDAIEEVYIAGKALGPLDAGGNVTSGDYYVITTESVPNEPHFGTTFELDHTPIDGVVTLSYNSEASSSPIIITSYGLVGKTVTLDDDYGSVNASYKYSVGTPYVTVRKHLGGPSDPADAQLMADVPDKWFSTSVLRGFTYTVVVLNLNKPEFQSGIPTIEVLVRGKKLYDPRTGLTAWKGNPALVVYDYLTSEICGVPSSDLPAADYIAAANVCDEAVSIGGLTFSRYDFNGTITSDQDQAKVLEKMAQSMAGSIVSTTWGVTAGKYVAPVMALNQADIVGSLSIVAGVSDADLYNGVRGQYISQDNIYVPTDFEPYQNLAYAAIDGRDLFTNIDFPYTDSKQMVHNLCRIFVEDQRNGFTVKGNFSRKAWALKVGNRITLTSPFFGWSAKVFRVTDKIYSPTTAVELTLKEDAESIWDYADAVSEDATPNTNLENPYAIAPLASLACESGTNVLLVLQDGSIVSRIKATWPQATTQAVVTNGLIEIEWINHGGDTWQKTTVNGSDTTAYLSPVQDGLLYTVRARAINPYFNVKSDWVYVGAHRVIGKTDPPADVPWFLIEGNTLTWGTVGDIDLAGYIIRYHYGLNRSWGDAHPLHDGVLTQIPYTPDSLPQGQITLMIKSVDTSGNVSGMAAVIQTQFGDVLVANVVETFDFKVGGYPGTITGGTISGGVIQANSISNFYGDDSADFFNQYDSAPFYVDNYSALTYETRIFTPTKAAVDSQMTLRYLLSGDAQFIEYRASGGNAMFPALDSEPFYGDDASPFYGEDPVYQPWPGQITAKDLQYQFRFSTGQSANQGALDTCNAVIDVPDVLEKLNDIVISAAGTRLPKTKSYSVITNVQLTLEADGGTAFKPEIADKNASLGPLVYCRDSSGALTSGKVDAVIQGY